MKTEIRGRRSEVRRKGFWASLLFASVVMLGVVQPVFGVGGVQPPGYTEGLKVDKDGMVRALDTEKKITFPNGVAVTASNLGLQKEFYIAVRTDEPPCVQNVCGSGTKLDPFNAGGASPSVKAIRLTAIWTIHNASANFYYAPGTYYTLGWYDATRLTANPYCKHFGSGRGSTIIKLYGAANGALDGVIFSAGYDTHTPGFEVRNMTLDCDAVNQPKWSNPPVAVGASDARFVKAISVLPDDGTVIDNVEVINFGTHSVLTECFPILVVAQPASPVGDYKNVMVSNCYVHQPATGNLDGCSAIVVAVTQGASSSASNLRAEKNVVDMTGSDFTYSHGVTAQFMEGNTSIGCTVGTYFEPDGVGHDYTSRNDTFKNCNLSIQGSAHAGSTTKGIYIYNPYIETAAPSAYSGGIYISADDLNTSRYGEIVINGARMLMSNGSIDATYVKIAVNSTLKATITNNLINSSHGDTIRVVGPALPDVSNNRTTTGTLVGYSLGGVITSQRAGVPTDSSGNVSITTNGTIAAALLQGNLSGNGSLVTQVQARSIDTAPRIVNNANVTINTSDFFVVFKGTKSSNRSVELPPASESANKFLYMEDDTGDSATNTITVFPDLLTGTYVFNSNTQTFVCLRSDGINWRLVYQFPPP